MLRGNVKESACRVWFTRCTQHFYMSKSAVHATEVKAHLIVQRREEFWGYLIKIDAKESLLYPKRCLTKAEQGGSQSAG